MKKPMKKVKRYSGEDGESVIEDESDRGTVTPEQKQAGLDSNSFGDAFKSARAAGDSTFTWRGKSYGTKLASETKPDVKSAPKTESKPKAEVPKTEPKSIPKIKASAPKTESKPYKENDSFETKVAKLKSKPYNEDDSFETKVAKLKGKSTETPKPVPKTKEDPAAAAKAMREAIAGPDKNLPASEPKSAAKRFRESLGSSYKAGGAVKSSASRRGDGIATKGRTRGKMC